MGAHGPHETILQAIPRSKFTIKVHLEMSSTSKLLRLKRLWLKYPTIILCENKAQMGSLGTFSQNSDGTIISNVKLDIGIYCYKTINSISFCPIILTPTTSTRGRGCVYILLPIVQQNIDSCLNTSIPLHLCT